MIGADLWAIATKTAVEAINWMPITGPVAAGRKMAAAIKRKRKLPACQASSPVRPCQAWYVRNT